MRIAIVINTSWNIFNFRKNLVLTLLEKGHQVIAIAPQDAHSEHLVSWGCEFFPLEMENKGTNPVQDLKLILELRKIYLKARPDVILQYTIKPNIYGSIAAKRLKIPTVCNVSGLGTIFIHPDRTSSKVAKRLYKYAFKFPAKVFFQNPDDRDLFLDENLIKPSKTGLLPGSGVDLTYFKREEEYERNEVFTFLMVSRALYDKGTVEYAQAAKLLKEKYGGKVRCCLLGKLDDSRGSVAKEEIEEWLNSGILEHLGVTDNVKSELLKADCVVLPSYREGTPRTLLEAMALAIPIVTTDVPGCRETVINEKNGYLCAPLSSQDLFEKMDRVFNLNFEELKTMGKESRKLAEQKFDEKIVIQSYLDIINAVC